MNAARIAFATLPLVYLGLSGVAFCASLHTASHHQRLAYLPFTIVFAGMSLFSTKHVPFAPDAAIVWAQILMGYILHTISILHIERVAPPPRPLDGSDMGWIQRQTGLDLRYFRLLWLNPRLVRVPWSKQCPLGPEYSSRTVFLLLQASRLLMYYFVQTRLMPAIFQEIIVDILPEEVSPPQQSLLRPFLGFTARECLIVAFVTISTIWKTVVYLDGARTFMALCGVLTRLDDPEDWPPLFGSLSTASSLRRFWAIFWQDLPTKPYKSIGKSIAARVAGQGKEDLAVTKVLVAFVAFGLSGVTHAFIDWQRGRADWQLDIWWFLLNFLGCTAEVGFIKAVHHVARAASLEKEVELVEESWLGRFIGYLWVISFFGWITPMWRFPDLYKQSLAFQKTRSLLSKMSIAR